MTKKKPLFFIITMSMFVIIHLVILILELIPRVLYPAHMTINYLSVIFLVEVLFVTVFCLLRKKYNMGLIIFNAILLIPAFFIFKIEISSSESQTSDVHTYLKFDNEEISEEISSYFPLQIEDETTVKYSYFYETFDIIFYSGTNVEVCLEQKLDANEYDLAVTNLKNQFPNTSLKTFENNNSFMELSFIDNLDYTTSTIKKGIAKKILINDSEHSITFVYIKVEDKINKDRLYYFKNIVDRV